MKIVNKSISDIKQLSIKALIILSIVCIAIVSLSVSLAPITAKEIVKKADERFKGKTNISEMTIQIIRKKWKRTMTMKGWSKGTDYSVSLVTAPAKEKGIVFLKRKKEIYNYMPSINRIIKLPPSMMMQSWMGTDLTNDDLVKQSSIVVDYTHKTVGTESVSNYPCYKIELTPKDDAPVVWGKVVLWIDKVNYMQMKSEFYDEDDDLVNKMIGSKVKMLGGKKLPSQITFIPINKKGRKTIITYNSLVFDKVIPAKYFTKAYMKRIK